MFYFPPHALQIHCLPGIIFFAVQVLEFLIPIMPFSWWICPFFALLTSFHKKVLIDFLIFFFPVKVCFNFRSSRSLMKLHRLDVSVGFFFTETICEQRSLRFSELQSALWICGAKIIPYALNCIQLAINSKLLCAYYLRHLIFPNHSYIFKMLFEYRALRTICSQILQSLCSPI